MILIVYEIVLNVLNCNNYWFIFLDKLKIVVNGNIFNNSGEVEMIFFLM